MLGNVSRRATLIPLKISSQPEANRELHSVKQLLAVLILVFSLYVALAGAVPNTGAALPLERAADEIVASVLR